MAGVPFAPVQNGERSPYGGGGGGKVRTRRAQKRNATPYDRPAVGRHASAGPQAAAALANGDGGGAGEGPRRAWLGSGLLGTASKIVTTGASYLYSSIFKRREEPLRLNDVDRTPVELVEGQADASPSAAEAESTEGGSQHLAEDKTLEVERWMKRIFPREEADRLIGILRSSVKENGIGEEKIDNAIDEGRIAIANQVTKQVTAFESTPNNGPQSDAQRWREERTKARQEQKTCGWVGGSGLEDHAPTGAGPSEDGEAMDSSPINLARAYMGERVTKLVGPPRLALTQEKTVTPRRVSPYQPSPYRLKSRQVAQDQEGKLHLGEGTNYSGQLESPPVARYLGLPPPVAVRGRDNMFGDKLRTPPFDRTIGRISACPRTNPPGSAVGFPISREGSKKRGSSALEDGGGGYFSGGPIRRLRPRSSLYTPSPASTLQRRGGMSMYPPPSRMLQTPIVGKQKQSGIWSRGGDTEMKSAMLHSEQKLGKSERQSTSLGNHNFGVVQSETARKILETLDMMTPSPKEKSLDTELALVRERPPTELTASMMNEKARQTMESWDYPGLHQDEEPGPSRGGRNLESDLSLVGEMPWNGSDHGTKSRVKGKAPASTSQHSFQEKSTDQGPERLQTLPGETLVRSKDSFPSLANAASSTGRNKGFQINADVDDSDEEVRGGNINVQTTRAMSTSTFSTGMRASSGAGSFTSNPVKAVKSTTVAFGSTLASESQMPDSESSQRANNSDGKPSVSVPFGGFTFPSSNLSGGFMEAPPTPKPFPSPSLTGSAPSVTTNGGSTYNFNTGPVAEKSVFTLPSAGTAGATTASAKPKFEFKTDISASSASPAVSSAPQLSTSKEHIAVQAKHTELSKNEGLTSFGTGVSESFSPIAAASTTSTFSLSNFGSPGAGAKPGLFTTANNTSTAAGTLTFAQTASANASIFGLNTQAQTTASVIKTEASSFAFGKPPTASVASETPTTTAVSTPPSATSSIFGTSTTMAAPTTAAAPNFSFGSAPVFGQSRSSMGFGTTPSTTSGFGVQSADSLASLSEMSRPQKKMFGQVQSQDSDRPGSGVTFGLSSTATTSTSAPSSGGFLGLASSSVPSTTSFSIPSFGQSSSSPAEGSSLAAVASKPLFGLPPASTTSALAASSSGTPAPATLGSTPSPFGASSASSSPFGSSVFGAMNGGAPFGGASSSPAFGGSSANNKPFGGFSSEVPSQGSTPAPVFSGFGAPATLGAASSPPSTFSFGGASASASSPSPFGLGGASSAASTPASTTSASPFSFGAPSAASSSAFSFGGSSATTTGNPFAFNSKPASPPVFGLGSSASAFGSGSSASAFGSGSSASAFGSGSSASAFGSSSPNGGMAHDGSGENTMEDSMAEESHMMGSPPPAQQAAAPVLFGAPQTPSSGTFLFGKQPNTPSPGVFSFGNPQTPPAAGGNTFTPPPVAVNPFATPPQQAQQGGLNFGGGGFNVGTSGQDNSGGAKTTRKIFKAKRTVKRK